MNDQTAPASDGRSCPSENQTEAAPTAESRGAQTQALQSWLIEQYPATFNPDAPLPLKIGVHVLRLGIQQLAISRIFQLRFRLGRLGGSLPGMIQ